MTKKDNQKNKSGPRSTRSQRTIKDRLQTKLRILGVKGVDDMSVNQCKEKIKELKKKGVKMPDLRKNNGKEIKTLNKDLKVIDIKEEHLMEEVEIIYRNKETGKLDRIKKPTMIALLDKLRSKALSTNDVRELVPAVKEYFDRTMGKARQEVEFKGAIKTEEQRPLSAAEKAAVKAYHDVLLENE